MTGWDALAAGQAAPASLRPGAYVKHYELIRKLGEGGMGVVFLARDTRLGRLVAIKFLLEHKGSGAARILAEARATARCQHESIVVIHEVDEIGDTPYMVLEYVEGPTLRAWMSQRERGGPLDAQQSLPPGVPRGARRGGSSPGLVVELMLPVVRALAFAHEMGIVHRDLKPENIVLADSGQVKVLDFGIAKRLGEGLVTGPVDPADQAPGDVPLGELTLAGPMMGTLPYMSPEQWLGEPVDARSDLWAIGVILFELLVGEHPVGSLSPERLRSVSSLDRPMPSAAALRPDAAALGVVIDSCLVKRRERRIGSAAELWAALEPLSRDRGAQAGDDEHSPFAGLAAFQEADAARFFGRERDVAAIVGRLRNLPLVAVAGPSGAGKSSFVRAGVIPALKRAGGRREAFIVRPGRRPLAALADIVVELAEALTDGSPPDAADPDKIVALLRAQPGYLGVRLRARCRRLGGAHRILLFIDQFEELYTLGIDKEERAAFVSAIEGVADDASSPLRAILTVRSDFLDRLAEDRRFLAEVTRGLSFLPPIGRDGLREALTRPLEAIGFRIEDHALVDEMLDALGGAKSPLPLLQFTAGLWWEARDRDEKLLTRDGYRGLGGVAGALSSHADAVLSGLPAQEQRLLRAIVMRLVTPERTRAIASLTELRALADDGGAVEEVVHRLAAARLLLIETDERGGTTVELVHESLIETWGKLRKWLEEDEEEGELALRLRAAAAQWEAGREAEGLLWRDHAAEEATQWLRRKTELGEPTGLGKREERYLRAVVALTERTRRRRRGAVAALIAALSLIAIAVSLLAVRENEQARRADEQARRADEQARRAAEEAAHAQSEAVQARNATRMAAAHELLRDPTTVLSLLREVEPAEPPRGWSDLAYWAVHSRVALVVLGHESGVFRAELSPDGRWIATASEHVVRIFRADGAGEPLLLPGHEDTVFCAAFSPDGQRIVTASADRTARIFNADGKGETIVLRGNEHKVFFAAWSPDGKRVVTASADKTARIFNADGSGEPIVLRGHEGQVGAAVFSPDGERVVTASIDKTARVWSADGRGEPVVLRGHESWVTYAAFSPDGKRVVTSSVDKTARIFNADGKGEATVLRGHESTVASAMWSPDGARILTASSDKTARIWRADGKGEPAIVRGHDGEVQWAAWSPDGKSVVTASVDKTVRVYPAATDAGSPLVLRGHHYAVSQAMWSPDGERVVTASIDGTARIYSMAEPGAEPIVLRGHEEGLYWAAFSPDGKRVATASIDRTARIYNADGKGEPLVLRGHTDVIQCVAWSPDGRSVATASNDRTVRVWSADGSGEARVLRGHEGAVYMVSFSADGKRVITASGDRTARVWNADGSGEPVVLRGHEGRVCKAELSPDGTRVVTASDDRTARLWNADGKGAPRIIAAGEAPLWSASFSPDGKRVVTASSDQTVRVYDVDGKGEPLVLRGAEQTYNSAVFSPDGTRVVAASEDKTVWVWGDLAPVRGVDDPRLWAATSYCVPASRRVELLGGSLEAAKADEEACRERVKTARGR